VENLSVLKDLLDEKVIRIMNLFIDNPSRQLYLSEISNLSKINVSTTFRVLNRLANQGFLKVVLIGKVKMYQLEKNDKTHTLVKFLRKEKDSPLDAFIEKIKVDSSIRSIILESRSPNEAKLLIVGDSIPKEKIQKVVNDIREEYNYKIVFVGIFESQFEELKHFENYDLSKKIVWKRD
jgi:sugar-specific transcriptional regulator TrmB